MALNRLNIELNKFEYYFFSSLTSGAFEDNSFTSLAGVVSENTLKGINDMGFTHMTEIQHKSIKPLLEGR